MTTDSKTYYAKATFPANGWRGQWADFATACKEAEKFCFEWQQNGVNAKCAVFFRDGICRAEFGGDTEPDGDLNRMEHDDRGDN